MQSLNVAQQLIAAHLQDGEMSAGSEIALTVDQALIQDATGTMVMLELEALELDRVKIETAVQYVDHNLLQADERNPDDHRFLQSAAERFGIWFSRPGNGVSHPTHQQRFGRPGTTLVGSDSHTCAAGALGMLAVGVGGLDVAMALAGEPLRIRMPEIWGIRLHGELPPWVSAKDVILEMLRRHDVHGGRNRIVEYHGPGLASLTAMDRHVIANMGAELGATTTVFPSDEAVRRFLESEQRAGDWSEITAEEGASYDVEDEIDLSSLQPLIARPSSPGNVVPVADVVGEDVSQVVIGSSANPGLRDFAVVAEVLRGQRISPDLSLDVNPTSREILQDLVKGGWLVDLVGSGARLHQTGCLGCIGMGQAPATGGNSLRTMPRNFPGRSGTSDDAVWLCSPETAAAAALTGVITDPRTLPDRLGIEWPRVSLPDVTSVEATTFVAPVGAESARHTKLEKGPNISRLPEFDPLPEEFEAPVALKAGDNVSTDEILPAGAKVLPYRSNIEKISQFAFERIDPEYVSRVADIGDGSGHVVVGGENYGQGSSREHAAIAPRFLGLRCVIAKSFARIHWQNLANFGVLPLEFADPADYDDISLGDVLVIPNVRSTLEEVAQLTAVNRRTDARYSLRHTLSPRQVRMILAGGWIPLHKKEESDHGG